MFRKLLLSGLFIAILPSCNIEGLYKGRYTLAPLESVLSIPVGTDSKNLSFCIQYYKSEGREYLAVANHKQYSIEIFDLNTMALVNTIRPGIEGNNALAIYSFFVKNPDTIVGFQINPVLGLVTQQGEVIKRLTFDRDIAGRVNHFADKIGGSRPIVKDNIVNLAQEYREHNNKGILTVESQPYTNINTCIDLISGNVTTSPLTYPEELIGKDVSGMELCRTLGYNGMFVYHFRLIDGLFLTYDHKTFNKIPIETNYKLQFEEEHWRYVYGDMIEAVRYALEKDEVYSVYYDEYRECYYIVVRQRCENFDYKKMDFLSKFMFPHGFIIILDKNLKHMGDVFFPDNTYSFQMAFITPEGLYISEDHPNNPEFDEDFMRFRLFKLVKQ